MQEALWFTVCPNFDNLNLKIELNRELSQSTPCRSEKLRYNFYTMEFEFDKRKSASNQEKHGINFIEAQKLWEDEDRYIYPAVTLDEERFVMIAKLKGKLWSAIYTVRKNKTRLISVRRSRKEEEVLYEG